MMKMRILTMNKLTQQALDLLKKYPQCLDSIRQEPCRDYEARFGAFIRDKCGIITMNLIEWDIVAQEMEKLL